MIRKLIEANDLRGLTDGFQMLIEPLGRYRHRRSQFLREERNLELFNHPAKSLYLTLCFR